MQLIRRLRRDARGHRRCASAEAGYLRSDLVRTGGSVPSAGARGETADRCNRLLERAALVELVLDVGADDACGVLGRRVRELL